MFGNVHTQNIVWTLYCNFTSNKSIVDFLDIFRCRFVTRRRWIRLKHAILESEAGASTVPWGCFRAPPSCWPAQLGNTSPRQVLAPASVCGTACFSRFQRLRVTILHRKISNKSTIDLLEVKLQCKVQNIFGVRKFSSTFSLFWVILKNFGNFRPSKTFWTLAL